MMKAILFALFVGLLMVGCGGDIESKIQEAKESNATKLDPSDKGISDVSPLTGLTNLEELYLGDNSITDVSPLAGLTKLKGLGLSENQISDLSPLAELTDLRILFLQKNQISDLSPLKGLKNLGMLHLEGNPIPEDQQEMLKKTLPSCIIAYKYIKRVDD